MSWLSDNALHHDDRDGAVGADPAHELEPAHARETDVEQHQPDGRTVQLLQRALGTRCFPDGEAFVLEGDADRRPDPVIVLDGEDLVGHLLHVARRGTLQSVHSVNRCIEDAFAAPRALPSSGGRAPCPTTLPPAIDDPVRAA